MGRTILALLALLFTSPVAGIAQQSDSPDSTRAQIRTSLRAFYFNLAHQNWEALTADILAAKVVAHRPAPAALVAAATSPNGAAHSWAPHLRMACSPRGTPLVDQALMVLDGDWAEVSVPRCNTMDDGADEFRLIHFEQRWRIVYIDLFQQPLNVSTDR
ncbi:MAG TPA: hypothetical protein VFS51_09420 [Gemmatimonadales bacterium]|nr:hypothetical protein [Gemmatimonadales bacterium]